MQYGKMLLAGIYCFYRNNSDEKEVCFCEVGWCGDMFTGIQYPCNHCTNVIHILYYPPICMIHFQALLNTIQYLMNQPMLFKTCLILKQSKQSQLEL